MSNNVKTEKNVIKLCLVLSSLAGGGAERFFLFLVNHLNRSRFDIHLVLFTSTGDYSSMVPRDIQVVDLGISGQGHWLNPAKTVFRLRQTLRHIQPDLIFSTMGYTNLICMIAKSLGGFKAPVIIHEAGVIRHQLSYGSFAFIKKALYTFFCRYATRIVFPAKAVQDDFERYIPSNSAKYIVLPTPSDLNYIDQQLTKDLDLGQLGLRTDKKIIVSMGRLEPIKGIDLGIKAFAKLNKDIPAYYWILGQGPEMDHLKKLAQELGVLENVRFLGFQSNPFAFLKTADLYLLPSYSEALPNVIIEAMHCQCPCVATPYNASANELIQNGITGCLVDEFDENELATAMKELLRNPGLHETIQKNAKQKAQTFAIYNVVPQYEELFKNELLARTAAHAN